MAELINEKYYQYDTRVDAWSVIFSNRNGLSEAEVEAIFSKFGTIKKVVQTGDSFGFCIVKFSSKEAAIKCITAAPETRDSIKMRQFDKDKPSATRKTDNSSLLKDSNRNNVAVTSVSDRLKNLSSGKLDNRKKENNDVIESTNHQSVELNSEKKSQITHQLKRTKFLIPPRMPNLEQLNGNEKSNSVLHEQEGKKELKQSNNPSLSASSQWKDEKGGKYEFLDGKEMSCLSMDPAPLPKGLPKLIESKAIIIQKSIHPICNGPCCRECPAPPGVHEIIVANIDEACDVGFILNLFKDFEPLYISNMKVHGEKYFRYCHVYFKSYEDAKAVEGTYDRLKIHGKNLIVLRPESFAVNI